MMIKMMAVGTFVLLCCAAWTWLDSGIEDAGELFKELIRRVIFIPCTLGLSDGEIRVTNGTWMCKLMTWLYGADECVPEFAAWFPSDEDDAK